MCVNPITLPTGEIIACRQCKQCKGNYLKDWQGRCIAESRFSMMSHMVTLTYGADDEGEINHFAARNLRKEDASKFIRAIRDDGFSVRYFLVGEYGSTKGRAHWHVLLFWPDKFPAFELHKRIKSKYWPHGLIFVDECNPASVRYVMKYMAKDFDKGRNDRSSSMSTRPPLGDAYFKDRAQNFAEQGLSPQDALYSFPDLKTKGGKTVLFMMQRYTWRNFLVYFMQAWKNMYGNMNWPYSPMLEAYLDEENKGPFTSPQYRTVKQDILPDFLPGVIGVNLTWDKERPWTIKEHLLWRESLNCWCFDAGDKMLYWSFDEEGNRSWQEKIRDRPKPNQPTFKPRQYGADDWRSLSDFRTNGG